MGFWKLRRSPWLPLVLLACGCTSRAPEPPPEPAARSLDLHNLRNLGRVHAERDTTEGYVEAAAALRKAVEVAPEDPDDHLNLARALLFTRDTFTAAAAEPVAAAIARARHLLGDAAPPDCDYLEGLLAMRSEDPERAVELFRRVTDRLGDHVHGWYQRARAEQRSGRHEEAGRSYERLLEIAPRHRAGAYNRMLVLRRLGFTDELEAAKELFASIPAEGQPDAEKCDLTRVTLKRQDRRLTEPPPAAFRWREITEEVFPGGAPGGVERVLPFGPTAALRGELLLIGKEGARRLRIGEGHGGILEEENLGISASGAVRAGAIGDLDNDGDIDVVLGGTTGIAILPGEGTAAENHEEPGQPEKPRLLPWSAGTPPPLDLALFDIDHDGDLDIVALHERGAALIRNNGDGSWLPLDALADAPPPPLPAGGAPARLDAHDLDQANDLDLILPGRGGVQAFLNLRDGSYRRMPLPALGEHTLIRVEDLDSDGAPDIFAAGGRPGWSLARNADRLGIRHDLRLEEPRRGGGSGPVALDACLADLDNDGDPDILLATAGGVLLLRNRAAGDLQAEETVSVGKGGARSVTTADLDGDGIEEVIAVTAEGRLAILESRPAPAYISWVVRAEGRRDNRDGIGAVVEQHCGRLYQSSMIKGPGGIRLGLGRGDRSAIDGLRVRWPQGIVQALPRPRLTFDPPGEVRFRQKEGLSASCPYLYARGPEGWSFVTDVVGIAPLDEWLPPGSEAHLDPEEYVRIDGSLLAPRQGRLQIAVTEELRETTYLDRLELVIVDHPPEIELYTDESTRQGAYDPLTLHVLRGGDLTSPARVTASAGEDPLDLVDRRDRRYLHAYPSAPPQWAGWVEPYEIDLVTAAPAAALLLRGRVAWYDSTVVYAMSQQGRGWQPLSLQLAGASGEVRTLMKDIGVPAGMDRTMVVSIPGGPLPASSRLRLRGQHRFLWDRFLVAERLESVTAGEGEESILLASGELMRCRRAPALEARLGFHGYSAVEGSAALHEQIYDYRRASPDDSFPRPTGAATRYGEVTALVQFHDDLLVVLVPGDRVVVDFPAPAAPAEGASRTYFLRVTGWAKEASYHNRTGGTIEPLPFRAMSRYPPPPGEGREDETYRAWLHAYQSRIIRR